MIVSRRRFQTDGPSNHVQTEFRFANLMRQKPQTMQDIGMIRLPLQDAARYRGSA